MNILKGNTKLTDLQLLELYRNTGKSNSLGELFTRYSSFVVAVCMKYLKNEENSKDATMDIFEKLSIDLKTQKIQHFKSWLYSVVRNHCLMILRSDKTKQKHLQNLKNEQETFMENKSFIHLTNEEIPVNKAKLVENAVDALKEDQRECIKLFYYEEKTYQEIVELTGHDLNKIKSHLQNGKRNLQIALESEYKKLND